MGRHSHHALYAAYYHYLATHSQALTRTPSAIRRLGRKLRLLLYHLWGRHAPYP